MNRNVLSRKAAPAAKRSTQKLKLPHNFEPGEYAVICGRGKLCSASPGNRRLRLLVKQNLVLYSRAKNKSEKSAIVSFIMNQAREASPGGAFVKQEENGEWWEVGDSFAREKIGCIFRDILHTQYRSSTRSKLARKKAQLNRDKPISTPAPPVALKFDRWYEDNVESTCSSMPDQRSNLLVPGNVTYQEEARTLQENAVVGERPAIFSPPMMPTTASIPNCCSSKRDTTTPCLCENRSVSPDGYSSSSPYPPLTKSSTLHARMEGFSSTCCAQPLNSVAQPDSQTTPSCLLRRAHSLLQEALSVVAIEDVGDEDLLFPDDLSEIFEDNDDDNSSRSVW